MEITRSDQGSRGLVQKITQPYGKVVLVGDYPIANLLIEIKFFKLNF